jgi:hypothetical protein
MRRAGPASQRCALLVALLLLGAGAAHGQDRDPADPGATPPDATHPAPARPGAGPRAEPPVGHRPVPERIDPAQRFSTRERDQFRSWAVAEYGRGKCPPGLAKGNGGCVPRGYPRKRDTVGLSLPASTAIGPVPLDLARRIGTPPTGARYGIVDGDLVKLDLASGLVLDAIDGFVPKQQSRF